MCGDKAVSGGKQQGDEAVVPITCVAQGQEDNQAGRRAGHGDGSPGKFVRKKRSLKSNGAPANKAHPAAVQIQNGRAKVSPYEEVQMNRIRYSNCTSAVKTQAANKNSPFRRRKAARPYNAPKKA